MDTTFSLPVPPTLAASLPLGASITDFEWRRRLSGRRLFCAARFPREATLRDADAYVGAMAALAGPDGCEGLGTFDEGCGGLWFSAERDGRGMSPVPTTFHWPARRVGLRLATGLAEALPSARLLGALAADAQASDGTASQRYLLVVSEHTTFTALERTFRVMADALPEASIFTGMNVHPRGRIEVQFGRLAW